MSIALIDIKECKKNSPKNRLEEIAIMVVSKRAIVKTYHVRIKDTWTVDKSLDFISKMFRRHNIRKCYVLDYDTIDVIRNCITSNHYSGYLNNRLKHMMPVKGYIIRKSRLVKDKTDNLTFDDLLVAHNLPLDYDSLEDKLKSLYDLCCLVVGETQYN